MRDRAIRAGSGSQHLPDGQRAHFGPLAVPQRDHGAIDTEHQRVRTRRWRRVLVQDAGRLGRLERDGGGAGRFGEPPGGIAMDGNLGKPGQFRSGFGKRGDPGTEANQRFVEPGGQAPRQ